jgi:hypothetical protein
MPNESVVSLQAIGAARVIEWWHTESGTEYSGSIEKPASLSAIVAITAAAPWSQTGKDGLAIAAGADRLFIRLEQINGVWLRVLKMQGSVVYRPAVTLTTARPGANFTRSLGRYVFETLANWSAAPGAGVDSGIGYCPVDHGRVVAGSAQNDGMIIGNIGGVLKFASRGPGGYEEVDLSAFANPLTEWNRIGLVLRHATKDSDASVTAIVNSTPAMTRTWAAGHKLPELAAATGRWFPQLTHAEVATYLRTMEHHFYAGPDVDNL